MCKAILSKLSVDLDKTNDLWTEEERHQITVAMGEAAARIWEDDGCRGEAMNAGGPRNPMFVIFPEDSGYGVMGWPGDWQVVHTNNSAPAGERPDQPFGFMKLGDALRNAHSRNQDSNGKSSSPERQADGGSPRFGYDSE